MMTAMGVADERGAQRPEQLVSLAVDRAYLAFAGHRVGPTMRVRRHDIDPPDAAALAAPVRTVTAEALDRWLPHAVTTWGTAHDLRALLPRVLELFARGELATPPEVVFAKVRRAGVAGWSVEEQAAVDDVVAAVWLATLSTWPPASGLPAWRVLVAAAELGGELSALLDDWSLLLGSAGVEQAAARQHLEELVAAVERLEARGAGLEALFWSPHPAESERLTTWLAAPFVQAHVRSDELAQG